jgi:TonB family protein
MTSIHLPALTLLCCVLVLGACATAPTAQAPETWPGIEIAADQLQPAGRLSIPSPSRNFYQARPSGTTMLRLAVDALGKVRRTEIVESSGDSALDASAARSLLGASFVPHLDRGVAVAVTTVMPIRFRGGLACNGIRPSNC